ncbi:MAG: hypothetical protein M3Y31_00445, partial [Gemmatimonadota bacterium]|nr:hypothetical protein [Gemmatimonadota bacterium]
IRPIVYALIVLYSGELVWKDRNVNVDEMADAAPVPDAAVLLGRFLALAAMIVMFQAALMAGGVLIQTLQGYYTFEPALYLEILFGLGLAEYLVFAVLMLTIQVLVNHRYLGHMIVVMTFMTGIALWMLRIVRHHLLLYGTDPGWTYSDMNGFGPFIGPFVWFKLYWGAWALLLAVVAALFWPRGRESGARRRLATARTRLVAPLARAAGTAIVLILGLGGFIFYNTNVLNEYLTPRDAGAPQARYEERYARYEGVPQPTITDADLRIEIHPEAPAVEARGSFTLVNRTGSVIDSVHVYLQRDVTAHSLSFDRRAEAVLVDEEVGYRIYELERALGPGDAVRLTFDVAFRPQGFRNSGNQTDVVANGAYFHRIWLPFIGYQPVFELSDPDVRARFDLAPRPPAAGPEDLEARRHRWGTRDADLVHVSAIIGTAADQIAVTPGVLQRTWSENGRRYFHYETPSPIAFGGTVASARYAVLQDRWRDTSAADVPDVALQIFHHPAHAGNLGPMVRSMKASLAYFTREFGRYPYGELRIVEIPRYGDFGSAHPGTIAFAEDVFLTRIREGEMDQAFYGTAHEVAHTWWGGLVRGGQVRGAGFLSESLANYSAMMVVEETYGPEAARRVYDFQMERYLRGRAMQSHEAPLLEVEDQPYIAYRKGAIAMYTLREHIGAERVNAALRRYFEKHSESGPPYPTSYDLYAELRAATPDSLGSLLTDWFEAVTLWEVTSERAVAEAAGNGDHIVTLDIVARKLRADSVGVETEVPMNDLVEIGVFAAGTEGAVGKPLYLERHRIRSGRQTLRIR